MQMLRKTKSDCVVSISQQELALIASALNAELASGTSTQRPELAGLLRELLAAETAAPTRPGVPEVLKQLIAVALASRG